MTAITVNGKTVVLQNADTNPHAMITVKKAYQLIAREKAVIVEADPVRTFGSYVLPLVVRLKEYVYVAWDKLNGPPSVSKKRILVRDKHTCAYCGYEATTIDHVHPRSKGGKNTWENLVAACGPCNKKKGNRTLTEIGWKLPFKPYAPTRSELREVVVR